MGLGKTCRDVKCLVEVCVRKKGTLRGSAVSNGWWDKFLKRNPMLSLRSGDSTAGIRMDAMNVENMKEYFDLLRKVYDEYEFNSHPECIYNMDETGVPLQPRPPKVIAKRGQKKIRYRTSGGIYLSLSTRLKSCKSWKTFLWSLKCQGLYRAKHLPLMKLDPW